MFTISTQNASFHCANICTQLHLLALPVTSLRKLTAAPSYLHGKNPEQRLRSKLTKLQLAPKHHHDCSVRLLHLPVPIPLEVKPKKNRHPRSRLPAAHRCFPTCLLHSRSQQIQEQKRERKDKKNSAPPLPLQHCLAASDTKRQRKRNRHSLVAPVLADETNTKKNMKRKQIPNRPACTALPLQQPELVLSFSKGD